MKKALIAGVASLALAAMPVVASFADEVVDTITVNVSPSCTLSRLEYQSGGVANNTSHKNGTESSKSISGAWSTKAGEDTLAISAVNGSVSENLGNSQFKVVCNNQKGYDVTVETTALTGATSQLTIPNNTTYSASVSGWSPIIVAGQGVTAGTKLVDGGTVSTLSNATTAGATVEVKYGVGISSTQAADTYTGTATYKIAGK